MNQKRIEHAAVAACIGRQENIAPPKTARGDCSFPFRGALRDGQSTTWKGAVEEGHVLRICHFAFWKSLVRRARRFAEN